jgi:very-short-patch-repair endonuclease
LVYKERKKYFSKYSLIDWYIKNYNPKEKDLLLKYIDNLIKKCNDGQSKMYSSDRGDSVRKKQKDWSNSHASEISDRNKKLWSEPLFFEKMKKTWDYSYENHGKKVEDFYRKNKDYIKTVMNRPERVKKISDAAKKKWEYWVKYDNETLYRLLNSSRNKNYEINGYKVNSIEYQIGTILSELKLNWKYEKGFIFDKKCYLPDFYIDDKKLVVECYGDYWHANPNLFKETDKVYHKRTSKDIWEYDRIKQKTFEDNGYKYLYFWETDIIEDIDKIKEKLYKEIEL